jgi:hypothetical protein
LKADWYWVKRPARFGELPPVVLELVDPPEAPEPPDPGAPAEPPAPRRPKPAEATLDGTPWLSRHCVNLARDAAAVDPAGAEDPAGAVVDGEVEEEVLVLPPPHAAASRATPINGRANNSPNLLGREPSRFISVTDGVQTTDMKQLPEKVKSLLRSPHFEEPGPGGWRPCSISAILVPMFEC